MRKQPTLNEVVNAVKDNPSIVYHQDVYNYLGISSATYYKWYPTDSEDRCTIEDALESNKTLTKRKIRDRLLESKNTAALLSLYRLLATKEERDALNAYKVEEIEAKKGDNNIELVID